MVADDIDTPAELAIRDQQALARLVDGVLGERDPRAAEPAEWQRVHAALVTSSRSSRSSGRGRFWLRAAIASAFAVSLALASGVLTSRRHSEPGQPAPQPMTYVVQGQGKTGTGFVQGEPSAGTAVRFSDGSRVRFHPHSVGRVLSSTPVGASVLVESGGAQFEIKHRFATDWAVYAGPFTVHVTGTQFDLLWSASDQTLDVRMKEGSVLVEGPGIDGGIRLIGGQSLRIPADGGQRTEPEAPAPVEKQPVFKLAAVEPARRSPTRSAALSPLTTISPVKPEPADHDPTPPDLTPAPAAAPPMPPRETPPLGWARRVAAGDFHGVVASARANGIESCLAGCSVGDLAALADAARYSSDGALAKQALLKLRARFPQSAEAGTAAFLLGRLGEQQDVGAALQWFDRCLDEAPDGPYAGMALGHKMFLGKSSGRLDARAAAREYLSRYPGGPYSGAARQFLADP
ncbi:MAG TPA: FecR domain-containing protein [Polyangia bacterium]|jgi:ferric-dicitrate binding protein FerR (iron transport regulator)